MLDTVVNSVEHFDTTKPKRQTISIRKTQRPKRTSIGKSKNSRPKNKNKRGNWKKYRGQGT
jgi:hypothetical protein